MSIRPVRSVATAVPTIEGAGVKLHRAFGFTDPKIADPFLLFDDFRNDHPDDYLAGFPWHPHRGIETITYVLAGTVAHGDSLGNSGTLGAGDIQWMTAGSGIMHQEMPKGDTKGRMHGFQLWANLPASQKMTAPRYQDLEAKQIPHLHEDDGTIVKVVAGTFWGKTGPVEGVSAEPQYLDIFVPAGKRRTFRLAFAHTVFAYVFEGSGRFADASAPQGVLTEKELDGRELVFRDLSGDRTIIHFNAGDDVVVEAGETGVRFLLISGKPLGEPVAWHGPIVMNTQAELIEAVNDLNNGNFVKQGAPSKT
ncbi:MAG: pirin family protein [Alphaproteobacteria bacterium]|nr:pirin family protein [Alphaproteobacteria bacterium]